MNGHTRVLEGLEYSDFVLIGQAPVEKNGLGRVAHRAASSLAIDHHRDGIGKIGVFVHVEVAISGARFDCWHRCAGDDGVDQAGTAAGDHDVHQAAGRDQILDAVVRGAGQKLHGILGHVLIRAGLPEYVDQCAIGVDGRLRATKQRNIPRLQGQAESVNRHVRAGFINHAHHAERDAHLLELQAIRQGRATNNVPHGVGQRSHLAQAISNPFDAILVENQAVNEGLGHPPLTAGGYIFIIRLDNCRR